MPGRLMLRQILSLDTPRRRTWLLVAVALTALMVSALVAYSAVELTRFARAEVRRSSTFVYASGQPLTSGIHIRLVDLAGTLGRLRYHETHTRPAEPGQFRRTATAWDLVLRGQDGAGVTRGSRLHLEIREDRIVRITRDGRDVVAARLEGEVLAGGGDRGEDFRPLRLNEAPRALVNALLAAEDHRFYEHGAFDIRALARAAWANLRAGRVIQGGSTLTQQLVKSRLLTPRRTVLRKVQEAWLSVLVEGRYSKQEILEAYLNEIYLGQRGPLAIRGVGAAARAYFGKETHQLTAGEAALLAGMVRAPNTHSPVLNPARARKRRDAILARMRELGTLGGTEYERARREPVRARTWAASGLPAPYFADYVRQELEARFEDPIARAQAGARIFTALDPVLQRFAEMAVARGLDRLETGVSRLRRPDGGAPLQAALIVLDPATGEIRTLVGGRDYGTSQFNRAILARRQPGSAFKPFVYATALSTRAGRPRFTAASIVDDSPISIPAPNGRWSPRNYDDHYEGRVTVRRALEQSLNSASVRIAQAVGPAEVVETARAFGFGENLAPVPAAALGAFEVTPLELARAYVPFANAGRRPGAIRAVRAVYEFGRGRVPLIESEAPAQVISPAEAYVMTALLQGVVRSGTGAPALALGVSGDVAGKTGTTNEGRDAWFVGYSSRLLAVVWVGFDDGRPLGLSGAQAALPIWADFMRQALEAYSARPFTVPAGVTFAEIDVANGKRANGFCPLVVREAFLTGTEPELCTEHGGFPRRVGDWWRRFRDWLQR